MFYRFIYLYIISRPSEYASETFNTHRLHVRRFFIDSESGDHTDSEF